MGNSKYKILVLSDLKETTNGSLKKAVKLSKTIGADIALFCVKKPTDIVATDSQLSAMRSINKEYIETERKMKNIIAPIIEKENVNIETSFVFGNIKNEIEIQINSCKPDIIVLGHRKRKVLSFVGDKITDFVLKSHQGTVVISSDESDYNFENEFPIDFLKRHEKQVIVA